MSTDYFGVRIHSVEDKTVELSLSCLYIDLEGQFPDPFTPFPFFELLAGPNFGNAPRGVLQERFSNNWYEQSVLETEAPEYITHVEITDAHRLFERMNSDFLYEQEGHWPLEEELPRVFYRVHVSDSALLAHLSPGQGWGSTCSPHYLQRTGQLTDPLLEAWLLQLQLRDKKTPLVIEPQTIDRLCAALLLGPTDKANWYTWNAAELLGTLGTAAHRAIPLLSRLITDPDLDVAGYSVEALGNLAAGNASVAHWIAVQCARKEQHGYRDGMVRALASIGVRSEFFQRFFTELEQSEPTEEQPSKTLRAWARWRCTGATDALQTALAPLKAPSSVTSEDTVFFLLLANTYPDQESKELLFPLLKQFAASDDAAEGYKEMVREYLHQHP